ncbi:hypothetical protein BAOM_2962 [Peribacillus asahii]|uniref:Uncharacterized protein n=1 Tax=Peribacillus asahii TaxID=228899 RepID=A0A3Q9RNZ7_9BACI|nr:hypothetical protein [Peribacillus asahii]AZV43571.1 hypothetical protein BAOM_2962 [Peribacillus asahii]
MNEFRPVIQENKKETLTQCVNSLTEVLDDLYIAIDNLDLTETQRKIIDPVVDRLGSELNELSEEIYFT